MTNILDRETAALVSWQDWAEQADQAERDYLEAIEAAESAEHYDEYIAARECERDARKDYEFAARKARKARAEWQALMAARRAAR